MKIDSSSVFPPNFPYIIFLRNVFLIEIQQVSDSERFVTPESPLVMNSVRNTEKAILESYVLGFWTEWMSGYIHFAEQPFSNQCVLHR